MVEFTAARPDVERRDDDLSSPAHRRLLGYIGLLLPPLLVVMVKLRDGEALWQKLDSVSAYYYSGAVSAFVGMLVGMALFLFTYRGYRNDWHRWERAVGIIAGVAALGVAIFPTKAPMGVPALSWWQPWIGATHFVSAIVLFLMFAVFALLLFPLSSRDDPEKRGQKVTFHAVPFASQLGAKKSRRNMLYYICGLIILGAMGWALYAFNNDRSFFIPESIALAAFAVSWLVKGRAQKAISDRVRSFRGSLRAQSAQDKEAGD